MSNASTDSSSDSVVILSVSTILGQDNSEPIGSLMGGTTLFMKVQGLDQTASNNAVYIGKYPCIISDKGVNGLFMNCKTTQPDPNDTNLSKLTIVVRVANKPDSICKASYEKGTYSQTFCYYTYSQQYTPQLYYVTPRSNHPRNLSYWRARWTVSSTLVQHLNGQFMGKNRCDRFTVQDDYSDEIDSNDDIVVCQVSAEIEAGYYSLTINSEHGYQTNDAGVSQKQVYSDKTYTSKIVPIITSISSNFISPKGQQLEIKGYGFSNQNNVVKISGQTVELTVIKASTTLLIAEIPELTGLPKKADLSASTLYIQGSGLHYTRYNVSGLDLDCRGLRTKLIDTPNTLADQIIFDGIYPEPDVQDTFGSAYAQYFRGFLKAPVAGDYKFYLSSDDCSEFYIQTTAMSITRPTTAVAAVSSWSPYRNYWIEYLKDPSQTIKTISDSIALTENEYYYIELYHINGGGSGHATLSMEVENTGDRKSNSITSLYAITTSYEAVKEQIEISLYNSAANTLLTGTFKLQFAYGMQSTPQTDIYYNYVTGDLKMTTSISDIEGSIEWWCGYLVTITRKKLDSTGTELSDAATSFSGYKYTITFDSHRGDVKHRALPKLISSLTGGTLVSNIASITEPKDPISGTFELTMTINGIENSFKYDQKSYDLPFDASNSLLADNIERITGQRPFVWTEGRAQDGWTWYIKFRAFVNGLTAITGTATNLISGNGAVTITIVDKIPASTNLFFEPIPNELLFTFSTAPSVQVLTNDILAGCQQLTACDITLSDTKTPTLKTYSVSGSVLSLTLQAGVDLPTISPNDLTISFLGADCSNIKFTTTASPYQVTCNLEQLNNKNIQEAGTDVVPQVHNKNIGYSLIDGAVTGQTINLAFTSVSPNSGSEDGGAILTIVGSGFPKNLDRTFTLKIGGETVTPIQINNQQIVVIVPASQSGEIILEFNGKTLTDSTSYTIDPSKRMEVQSLEFSETTPVYRGLFTITGTNFGTTINDITVTLVGSSKSYNAKVISLTDTTIQVYLRGGMPGSYKVEVTRANYGKSFASGTNNELKYIIPVTKVTLEDGISEAKGSEAGGQVIKITGSNFVAGETMVFIGNAINWICEIDETRFTSEEIYCTVPAKNQNYATPEQPVIVTLSITLESICVASGSDKCTFTYDSTLNPTITAYPTGATQYSGSRILTEQDNQKPDYHKFVTRKRYLWTDESKKSGINHILNHGKSPRRDMLSSADLVVNKMKTYAPGDTETLQGTDLTATVKILFVGPVTQSVSATVASNQITYTIPELPQGQYTTYVQTLNGYADKIWLSVIDLSITSVTPSTIGGSIITISGSGFNAAQSPSITVGSTTCTDIQVVSSIQIKCRLGKQSGSGATLKLSQLPSENNSPIPKSATIWIVFTAQDSSPVFTTVTVNGANTFDNTKQAYTATAGNVVLVITGNRLTGTTQVVTLENGNNKIQGTISAPSITSITASFSNLPAGIYSINIQIDANYAYNSDSTKTQLIVSTTIPTSNKPSVSYAGGATLTFTGTGFDNSAAYNQVNLCEFDCPVKSSTFTTLTCEAPKLLTSSVLTQYTALQQPPRFITPSEVTIQGDTAINAINFFDLLQSTYYQSSAATNCFVSIDFGSNRVLKLHQLRYIPRIDMYALQFKGAQFQYTLDGNTWVTLMTIDQTVHTGWNIFVPASDISGIKAIRLFDPKGTGGSSCQIAEIELKGWVLSSSTNTYNVATQCDAIIQVNGQLLQTVSAAATYSSNSVPLVNSVTPKTGRFTEEVVITIVGTGFISGSTTVTIDGVICVIQSVSSTQIVCKTGIKDLDQTQLNGVFEVRVNGNLAVNNQQFIYANKWSDLETWGGYEQPGDGDSVIVNMGQTLIVDVKTPKLMQLLVEGTLTFSDDVDTSLDAHYIIIREGKFNIGTETQAHQHKVQITLHGQESDTQMPAMGNKVLGCHQCQLIIHGEERTPTWTLLSSTAVVGATQITVDDVVDWRVGEQIFIASSQIDHTQAETRFIKVVGADKKTLTLDQPLIYQHYSAIETYGSDQFPMKVEVGLLTRNIVIQAEESEDKYGYHLMIHGRAEKGSIGKISYAEFKHGGQPRIIGRYPIHFHLNGDVDQSYIIGNSIHDCYARCVTIHGVHYLKVQKNVCYNTFGHAIFLEDGIETNNVIEKNLVAGTKQSWIMLQTDITVATYWVTHPQNIVRDNRSAGSEWYGFWYEVKSNPDGPSATSDICPPGLNILEFNNNFAHSNGRFGLRIFKLAPRTLPCWQTANWANEKPYESNPSIQAVFQNFVTWKNNEAGILAEEMGNVLFKNSMIADSGIAGFQSHKTNFSEEGTVLDTALIVGHSNGNANSFDYYNNTRAIITPRTSGFSAKNIKMYNFGSNTALIGSCSLCSKEKFSTGTPKNAQFSNIKFYNSDSASKVAFQTDLDLFWDLDGSFSGVSGGAYILGYKKHLDGVPGCIHHPETSWDNSLICGAQLVTIRDILVNNPAPVENFAGANMKVYRLDSSNMAEKMNINLAEKDMELSKSFGDFYATGFSYNIHWKDGAHDPQSMGIVGQMFANTDKAVILRFNYSENRETFDIYRNINGLNKLTYTNISQIPDVGTCNHGDWFNDRTNKLFYFCASGKNKLKYEYTEVEGILCRDTCDSLGDVEQEDGFRYWSKTTTWIDGKVPVEGDSPVIQGAYKVILDVDPPKLVNLTVLGTLIFDETKEFTHLQAERIWARSGKIIAGSSENPFPGKITITLNGESGDNPLIIDSKIEVGNKVLAITKGLELYSKIPGTVWTRLTVYANAGDTQVTVAECTDWVVGDVIVFGPSGGDPDQREQKSIGALTGCVITLDTALSHDHFGAPSITIDKVGIGQFDMRAIVGHLTRNIKIEGGASASGLGGRVLIYHFIEPVEKIPRRGYAILHGVEFVNCGQFNSDKSGLDFRYLNSEIVKTPSEVIGCSFHDSLGILLTIQNSQYLTVNNNIFYSGFRALAQIYNSQYIKFQNNALIYVKKKSSSGSDPWGKDPNGWAALGSFVFDDSTKMTRDIVDISSNVGQGSQDSGFFVMGGSCSNANQSPNYNIQCSGVVQACFAIRYTDSACTYVSELYAGHSGVGIMISVPSEETQLDKSIAVENTKGIVIKPGPNSVQNGQVKMSNIYVSPLARPNCPKCYATPMFVPCSGTVAIQLATSSSAANMPLNSMASTSFDIICTNQKVDQHVFVKNVQFDNIKLNYDAAFPTCSNNAAFRQHPGAIEMTGQHYLANSPCTNCDFNALLYGLYSPSYNKLGWFGGCGSMICTGLQNILIEDQTGEFFGEVGQAIGNNTYFGPNVTYCSRQDSWNGYWCPGTKSTVLMFMSTAPDHSKRLYSPIQLTDGQFFNQINSYTEWSWDGPEPLNTRESKFNGLVTANTVINMTNAGTNPTSSDYWLSKKFETGSPNDWVIIKWQFQESQIIQVTVNNQVVLPGLTTTNKHHDLTTMTDQCGANNYFNENRTIHFVVNGKIGCKVSISLKNTLQISTRLSITTDEFFGDKFLQYARAQLGGDPYNFFIIGTKKAKRRFLGEQAIQQIDILWGIVDSAQIGSAESKNSNTNLAAFASKLESLTVGDELKQLGVVGLEVQQTQIQSISELKYTSTESTSRSNSGGTTTGNSGSTTGTGSTGNNSGGIDNGNTNNSSNSNTYNDLILVIDEDVNQTEDNVDNPNKPGTITAVKASQNGSNTVTIVLSVVFSVLGVALITIGLIYLKKRKLAQIMATRNQRVDNNQFVKENIMSERVEVGHDEPSGHEPSQHQEQH